MRVKLAENESPMILSMGPFEVRLQPIWEDCHERHSWIYL